MARYYALGISIDSIKDFVFKNWVVTGVVALAVFTLIAMVLQWWNESTSTRQKTAKAKKDAVNKVKSERKKKRDQQIAFFTKWGLSVAFLAFILMVFFVYHRPF